MSWDTFKQTPAPAQTPTTPVQPKATTGGWESFKASSAPVVPTQVQQPTSQLGSNPFSKPVFAPPAPVTTQPPVTSPFANPLAGLPPIEYDKPTPILENQGLKDALKAVAQRTSLTGIRATIESASPEVTFQQAYDSMKKLQYEKDDTLSEKFVSGVLDSAPQTALGIALAFVPYVGVPLAASYWAAVSAGSEVESKGKITPTNVAIDVAGDMLLGHTLEALFKAPVKTLISTIKKSFVVEGGTEVAQDILKYANDYRLAKTDQERDSILAAAKNYFTSGDILVTLGVGGVTGAGVGGAGQVASNYLQNQAAQQTQVPSVKTEVPTTVPEPINLPGKTTTTVDNVGNTVSLDNEGNVARVVNPVGEVVQEAPSEVPKTETAVTENKPKEEKTIKPSEAKTQEEIKEEATKTGTEGMLKITNTNTGEVTVSQTRPVIGKNEMKVLLTDKTFKENPVFTVNENKNLEFVSETSKIEITPEALQLNKENLNVGDTIRLQPDLLTPKANQQLRVYGKNGAEASTGMETIGEFEKRTPKTESSNFKLHKEIANLIDKYAQTIGEGYLPKGAAGVFYGKTLNIRVNGMNNLYVAAHEITHFLDTAYKITEGVRADREGNEAVRKELTRMYVENYPGGRPTHSLRTRVREGLATLVSKYVAFPELTTREYPTLVADFLTENGKFYTPTTGEFIKDMSKMVENYQGLSALDKIGARTTSDKVTYNRKSFMNPGDLIRTQLADEVFPIEKLDIITGRSETPKSVSLHLRQNQQINGVIANNIVGNKGYWRFVSGRGFKKTLPYNWGDLVKTIEKEQLSEPFGNYLVARASYYDYQELSRLRRALADQIAEIEDKKADGWTEEELKTIKEEGLGLTPAEQLAQAKKQYDEQKRKLDRDGITEQEAKKAYLGNKTIFGKDELLFDALVNQDLQLMNEDEVGLLSDKNFKRYNNEPGYATRKRQLYDQIVGEIEPSATGIKAGGTSVSSMIKRTGSSRTIINPLYQSIINHSEIVKKSYRQLVKNKLNNMASDLPLLSQRVDLVRAYDPKTGKTFYPQAKDPNIVISMKDGKRTAVLWDNYVKTTFDNLITPQNFDGFQRALINLSGKFTRGTTGLFPAFTLTNLAGDQISLAFNTKNKSLPLSPLLKGRDLLKAVNPNWETENAVLEKVSKPLNNLTKSLAGSETESSKAILEYLVLAGDRQTFMGNQELSPAEVLQKINGEIKGIKKATKLVDKGLDILSTPSKYSEIITRASEYAKAIKAGKPQIVALEEAGRVTAPFHHVGKWWGQGGKGIIKAVPFMNPSIQALEQSMRTVENPKTRQRALTILAMITAAIVGSQAYLLSQASDDQKRLYKDLTAEELVNYIWFPSADGKTLNKIKTQQYGVLGGLMNMMIGNAMSDTNYTGRDFVSAAGQILPSQFDVTQGTELIFNWLPSFMKTQIEVAYNRKSYPKVMPIENDYLLSYPVEQRFTEWTSAGAKLLSQYLGKYIGLSPVKIDYLLTGNLGRASGLLTGKGSAYDLFSGMTRKEYWTSGRTVQGYYDLKKENDAKFKSLKEGKMTLSTSEEDKIIRVHERTNSIDKLMTKFQKIDLKTDPQAASEYRDEIIRQINLLGEDGKAKKSSMNPFSPGEVMAADSAPKNVPFTPEQKAEWERLNDEAKLHESTLKSRIKQNNSTKNEEGVFSAINKIRIRQGNIVREATKVEGKKGEVLGVSTKLVYPEKEMTPIEKTTSETFDNYQVPRAIAYGIRQAEGGKINGYNLGAVDSNPEKAVKFNSHTAEATTAAKFLSGTANKEFYGNGEAGRLAFQKAWEKRDKPEEMLKLIEQAGYAGNPKTWKKRSIEQDPKNGAGNLYDSWSDFIMHTSAWRKWTEK